jgi:hypothetical protein
VHHDDVGIEQLGACAITRAWKPASCNGQKTARASGTVLCDRDLDLLATGAWFLGTGGGGDPHYNLVTLRLRV